MTNKLLVLSIVAALTGCNGSSVDKQAVKSADIDKSAAAAPATIHPEIWPKQSSPIARDPQQEQQIADLLAKMTLEEKVGQVIQADIASVTPEEVKEFHLGSVLNGGNSAPNNNNHSPAKDWLSLADKFWIASTDKSDGGVGIPALWGIDAVHGNNNVVGATIFPHNIGLGAANDPELMRKIGAVTAKEVLVTGIDWTFAPTIAVVQNDRWGRTFESFSEKPEIVASYAGKIVEGVQGTVNTDEFLTNGHLLANVKHFVGDGGTKDGIDQGETLSSEEELRDIHGAGYPPAIQSGALVVMASFNSWHGNKMHGFKPMLTDVLVERMGFDGFVVGDWNGHGQVKGCTNVSCAQAFNAGLDMFMAPDSWKGLYHNTLAQVKSGEITMERLDQAVSRILRVKLRAGLFDAGLPSSRTYAGKFELLGSAPHREVAREAVRKSLVLLKNNEQLLPLSAKSKVLVAGSAANNIGQQSGGWTLTWQGTGNKNTDFPNGASIYQGIAATVTAAGGKVELNEQGQFTTRPDVAIVVFGEQPYAEFQGDVTDVDFKPEDSLKILKDLQAQGIPTVSVFLSGRPMWVNPELNASDAFVAAWLPGSEGTGVADVLFRSADGEVAYDFTGRLSFSWPATPTDVELNVGNADYQPLFAYGYGLSVQDAQDMAPLDETLDPSLSSQNDSRYMFAGDAVQPWRLALNDKAGNTQVTGNAQVSASAAISVKATDYQAQEDTVEANWQDSARLYIRGNAVDLSRQATGDMAIQIDYQVLSATTGQSNLFIECETCNGELDISQSLQTKAGQGWQQSQIKLSCFGLSNEQLTSIITPFGINSDKGSKLQFKEIKLVSNEGAASCSL
ncbi:glycoside hydrolase family 3 protein [Paraglaciecola hydrolytica]|uniref:Beta-glucosidase n=1 Tax=Paraglaciecola hydrolytica TaxID=1799789 RepID=A0A148KLE2_9ALTE|nr:exo 1,3/1,4-beta-D-glucan glucohydrolase [Paraglaciecola hydrolytica]KXI27068.1 beta-glucosidase [Paraglaciecola hydrolytica]